MKILHTEHAWIKVLAGIADNFFSNDIFKLKS